MRVTLFAALALATTLGGCAGGSRVTILPPENGSEIGGVDVIDRTGKTLLLDKVGEQAATADPAKVRIENDSRLQRIVDEVEQTIPKRPTAFVIIFEAASSAFPEDQRAILEQLRSELARRPGAEIVIEGFTDSTGSSELNDKISLDRAQTFARYLGELGFSVDRFTVVGRGEREALEKNGDEVVDANFRRVVITVR